MSFLGRMWSWLSVRSINPSRKKCATRTASLDVGLRGILALRECTVSETRAWARQPAHTPASPSPAPGRTSERVPAARGNEVGDRWRAPSQRARPSGHETNNRRARQQAVGMCPLRPLPSSSCRLPVNGLATKQACVQPSQARVKDGAASRGCRPLDNPTAIKMGSGCGHGRFASPARGALAGAPACRHESCPRWEHCWFTCFWTKATKAIHSGLAHKKQD